MNRIAELLSPQRSLCQIQGGSKKRLLELVADVLGHEQEAFHPGELVAGMLAREKLGSTALGGGIAIPHCRLKDCLIPAGVLITLAGEADFETPDGEAVDLIFALVVPLEATEDHLSLLADLARLFSQSAFCEALRRSRSSEALYTTAVNWAGQSP